MSIPFNYNYRFIKSSWGVSINILGRYCLNSLCIKSNNLVEVSNIFFLSFADHILEYDRKTIVDSFCFFEKYVKLENFKKLYIHIEEVSYSLCDFQDEGLMVIVLKLLAEIYNISTYIIDGYYNKDENKYVFIFHDELSAEDITIRRL